MYKLIQSTSLVISLSTTMAAGVFPDLKDLPVEGNEPFTVTITPLSPTSQADALQQRVIDNFAVPSFDSLPQSPLCNEPHSFPLQEPLHIDPTAEVSHATDQSVCK